MIYADFAYYRDEYLGNSIEEADFPRYAKRASEEVDLYTSGRAADVEGARLEAVKAATCAIADILQSADQSNPAARDGNAPIQSERVDEHSITYAAAYSSARDWAKYRREQIRGAVYRHLAMTGLLHTGVHMR